MVENSEKSPPVREVGLRGFQTPTSLVVPFNMVYWEVMLATECSVTAEEIAPLAVLAKVICRLCEGAK